MWISIIIFWEVYKKRKHECQLVYFRNYPPEADTSAKRESEAARGKSACAAFFQGEAPMARKE